MGVITISRGSYTRGSQVAEKTAARLGYACVSRERLLQQLGEFDQPEIRLLDVFETGSSFLERFTGKRARYVAQLEAALLEHLCRDNVVYHGFAFHYFVRELPRVLRVRITADPEDRIRLVMERDRVSRKKAARLLGGIDAQRKKWSRKLYGIDPENPRLYDLVLHIDRIRVDDAVESLCLLAALEQFQTTPESLKRMVDLNLAAQVRSALLDLKARMVVTAEDGVVFVKTDAGPRQRRGILERTLALSQSIAGVREIMLVSQELEEPPSSYPFEKRVSTQDKAGTYFSQF